MRNPSLAINFKWLIIVAVLNTIGFSSHSSVCTDAFSSTPFITNESLARTITNLASLKMAIDSRRVNSPNRSRENILRREFNAKITKVIHTMWPRLSEAELMEKIRNEIARLSKSDSSNTDELNKEEEKRTEALAIENSAVDGRRVLIAAVQPGSFRMGNENEGFKEITLVQPFGIALTQTTQFVWNEVAKASSEIDPKKYKKLTEANFTFKGDLHPVESVSYEDVQLWLEAANALLIRGHRDVLKLFPDYSPGLRVRLPEESEWEYVARLGSKTTLKYLFTDDVEEYSDYSWIASNSGEQTHPVGQKKPIKIGRHEFYDFGGNVHEFVVDPGTTSSVNSESSYPLYKGVNHIARGFSFESMPKGFIPRLWLDQYNLSKNHFVGFRIAMSAPVKKQPVINQLRKKLKTTWRLF